MGKRRKAREVALQFLYQLDQTGAGDPTPFEHDFWKRHPVDDDTRAFAASLVRGSKAQQAKIDVIIAESTEHWDLDRLAGGDRNLWRMAAYGLLYGPAVPGRVAINKAFEIARNFGTADPARFFNAVPDVIPRA